MKKVRIGIIGLGGMGQAHIENVRKIEEAELAAVSDVDAEVARAVGEKFGVPWFSSYQELSASGLVDAVIVATPHYFHHEVAVCAFEHGLHVLSEKPLAVTVSQADSMLNAAKKAGKLLSVMHQKRTEPIVLKMRELVSSADLGPLIRTVTMEPNFRTQAYYESGTWRATWAGEGGGVIINQAPHLIDILILLAGLPSKIEAKTRTRLHNIEVEDEVSAFLEYPNGAWGYYYTSTNELPRSIYLEIAWEKGKLIYRNGEIIFHTFPEEIRKFAHTSPDMWGAMEANIQQFHYEEIPGVHEAIIRNFCRAILGKEQLISSGQDGCNTIEFINAIILSGKTGSPVNIPVDRKAYDELIEGLKKTSKPKQRVKVQRMTDPRFKK
jgi:predicted dehydrogenase